MTDYADAWNKWFPRIERAAAGVSQSMLEGARVEPGYRVLDLATGIGEPALTAARRVGPDGYVLGVDLSAEMIGFAQKRAEDAGLANVEFEVRDVDTLSLPAGTFDAALCRWGFMFVNDLAGVLGRVGSVLVPGGRLSVSVWASADEAPTLSLAERAAHLALGLPSPDEGANTPFALCDIDALRASLIKAGFEDIDVQRVPVTFEFTSPDEFVAYRQELSSRFKEAVAGRNQADQDTARQAAAEASEAYRSPAGTIRMENWTYCASAARN